MRNKAVGLLLFSISALMGLIIFSFNKALESIVSQACTHGTSCPMWGTLEFQTHTSIGIAVFVAAVSLYFFLAGEDKKNIKKQKDYSEEMKTLRTHEKMVFKEVLDSNGAIFQSEIVEKTGLSKVKVTRMLDKLEARNLVDRRRRGMTNIVVLKD